MTFTKTSLYLIVLTLILFGIGSTVEFYKKTLRKDKSKNWENRVLGFVLSTISVFGLYYAHLIVPLFDLFEAPFWTNITFYIAVFYFLQRQLDMKVLKKIMNTCALKFLKKAGLEEAQIQEIMKNYEEKKNLEN